jgi:O-antigen ligase
MTDAGPRSANARDRTVWLPVRHEPSPPIRQALALAGHDVFRGAIAGLLVVVRFLTSRPAWLAALTLLLMCVPVGRDVSASVNVTPGDLASAALAVAVVPRVWAGARLPRSGIWVAMAAAVFGFAMATLTSPDVSTSVPGFVRYAQLFVVVPVALVLAVRDRRDLQLVCGALLIAAIVEGAVGTWQYVTGTGASFAGKDVRAVGTFGALDVMGLATVVGIGIVAAIGLALVQRGRARLGLLALAALLVVPLLLSLSRGALLATAGATVVMLLAVVRRLALRTTLVALAVVIVLVGTLSTESPTGVSARVATIATSISDPDRSVSDRYDLWATATGMWRDQPLNGVGMKMFPSHRDWYAPLHLSSGSDVEDPASGFHRQALLSPHNLYLLVLSEQGLIGAFGIGVFLLGLVMVTWHRTRRETGPTRAPDVRSDGRLISAVAVGTLSWILIGFLFNDIGGQPSVLVSVPIGLALWWATRPLPSRARTALT